MNARSWLVVLAIATVPGRGAIGAEENSAPEYLREIKPLLAARCINCHGPQKQGNGLRLDAADAIRRGGDNGPALVAGKSGESLLVKAIQGATDLVSRMPPKGEPLSAAEINLLKKWIDAGALAPAEKLAATDQQQHWSFQKVVDQPLPNVVRGDWAQEPLDRFILARLEKAKLAVSERASSETLLRRLSLDFIGLPPTLQELREYKTDTAPDATERVVDRLLASPHYGERWGRHWLDLARYADSNGYTRDFGRSIWNYRQWVIEAINAGMPFDQFTIEQLAGDLLPQPTTEQLVATGFHRNTLINEEGGTDQEQFRIEAVADRVNTTGAVFLGLTLGCARCHSHKYDPITQAEYYQFFAFLNNCDEPTLEVPTALQMLRGDLPKREQIRAEIKRLEQELEEQRPAFETAQRAWEKEVTPRQRAMLPGPVQVAYDMALEKRDEKNKQLIEEYFKNTEQGRKQFPVVEQIYQLRQAEPKIPTTMILRERQQPRETFIHLRGDFLEPGQKVIGNTPAVLPPLPKFSQNDKPQDTTRLDLARWLVSANNPLTPRVMINRDWQKFFGRGLVDTEDDFGTQGTPPTHPALLDHLATSLVCSGWDTKTLHRRIVLSATYQQSSRVRSDLAERDPQNKLLARQARLRLDAEIIRDVSLASAGLLTNVIGGPSVFPPQPDGVFDFTQDAKGWTAATGSDRYRRGLYTHFWRSAPHPALTVFDAPGGNVSCTRRLRSNTPLQALTLANDLAFVECAQALAQSVVAQSVSSDNERLSYLFARTLSRQPGALERSRLLELISQERANGVKSELAVWTQLSRVLLNLDEMITRE